MNAVRLLLRSVASVHPDGLRTAFHRNLPIRKFSKFAMMTPQERFHEIQKRKHRPRLPSVLRKRKRILVLDNPEDIPREMQKLKDAMYKGTDSLRPDTLQHHWATLLQFTYKTLFNSHNKIKKPADKEKRKKIMHLGFPPNRHELQQMQLADSIHLKQMAECFSYLQSSFHASTTAFTTMMTAYQRVGQPEKAIALYEKMRQTSQRPDLTCFNVLIKAYGDANNSAEAVHVLDEMTREGIRPDVITYTSLIGIFARERDVDNMLKAYDTMLQEEVRPTIVTMTTLVDGLGKSGRLRECVSVFNDIKSIGITPTTHAFNAIIWAVARKGDVRQVWRLECFSASSLSISLFALSMHTYVAYSSSHDRRAPHCLWTLFFAQARALLVQMAEEGCEPDMITFNAMINAFVVSSSYKDAFDLVHTRSRRIPLAPLLVHGRLHVLT